MSARHKGVFERVKGSRVWWIDFRGPDGRRHREKVGSFAAAVETHERRTREVQEGRFVTPKPDADVTFAQIARERMQAKAGYLAASSQRTDEIRLGPLLAAFGALPAASISAQRIEDFLRGIWQGGRSKATANRYRSLLSSIYGLAVRNGSVATNPCVKVERFKESAGRVRFLSADEEGRLRETIRQECPDREADFDLALHTGARRGELFSLRRSGVDLQNRVLTVNGKTGQRRVHLNSRALAAIEQILARGAGELVCGAKREGQRDGRRWFKRCVRLAGVPNFRFHDVRHTFASRLVMAGVDLRSVQELLGHKSIVMTQKYAHLSPDHQRANVEKLAS